MKNFNRGQQIAVFAGIGFVAYLLFGGTLLNFFNSSSMSNQEQAPETFVVVQDLSVGQGALAESGDVLTVHYIGTLTDGRVFDSSLDRGLPFVFTLGAGDVIRGWDEG